LSTVYNYRTLRHVMTKNWCHFWSWYTAFSYYRQILKTWQGKYDVYSWKKLIWIAKKFAKFHARRLNRNENIPKSFLGGGYFFETPSRWLHFTLSIFDFDVFTALYHKNLAIANRLRVSCAHNTLRASMGLNITPWPWNLG